MELFLYSLQHVETAEGGPKELCGAPLKFKLNFLKRKDPLFRNKSLDSVPIENWAWKDDGEGFSGMVQEQ